MAHRILILGGGFGGISAAVALREMLPAEDEVILIERNTHFMMGLRKTWVLLGMATREEGQRPLALLEKRGIKVVQGTANSIDPASLSIEVNGERLAGDAMLVALGAQHAAQNVSGFADHAVSQYDPARLPQAAETLNRFAGGRVVIGIFGVPYPCPPAPFEQALLLTDRFRTKGVTASVEVFSPQPMSMPVLGEVGCNVLDSRMESFGILFRANTKAARIEAGRVVLADGSDIPFDLLFGVAAHRAPDVVIQSGLAEAGGWIKVNPQTLETSFPGVYAIGDVTQIGLANGLPLPKAGVFAEAEGIVAARNIADRLAGNPPSAVFEGKGGCFLEAGGGKAMMVEGHFLAQPAPEVTLSEPSDQHFKDKHAFEANRLRQWFGE